MCSNGYSSTSHANVHWMRRVLADGLRDQPYQCNCVVGAVDLPSSTLSLESEPAAAQASSTTTTTTSSSSSSSSSTEVVATPHLYFLDYLGTVCEVPFTAQGYCAYLLYGLWDSMWKRDMDYDSGIRMLIASINQMQKRFLVSQNNWIAKIVTKDGIRRINIVEEAERLGIPITVKSKVVPTAAAAASSSE